MNKFVEFWKNLNVIYKILIPTILIIVVVIASLLGTRQSTYQVLYSNLSANDSQDIVKDLVKMGIDYQQQNNGATILIDGSKLSTVRIQLANDGLPRAGNPGLESLAQSSIGDTQYDKEKKYGAALKGQLERDLVEGIDVLDSANVQLSIADNTSIFKDNSAQSKATVSVGIKHGQTLDDSQVKGIQNFVAAAVNMKASDVVVLNTNGDLLSDDGSQNSTPSKSYSNEQQITQQTEDRVKSDIMNSLSKIFGYNHVTINVRASINFDEIVKNIEKYDPQGTLVSSQSTKNIAKTGSGTTSPDAGTASNGSVPNYNSTTGTNNSGASQDNEEIIQNFEVGKTVETVKQHPELTNLNVVVWVDRTMKQSEINTLKSAVATAAGLTSTKNDGTYDNGQVQVIPVVFNQNENLSTNVTKANTESIWEKLLKDPKFLMILLVSVGMLLIILILLAILGKKKKVSIVYEEMGNSQMNVQDNSSISHDDRLMRNIGQHKAKLNDNIGVNSEAKEKQKMLLEQVRKASEDVDKSREFIRQNLHEE